MHKIMFPIGNCENSINNLIIGPRKKKKKKSGGLQIMHGNC